MELFKASGQWATRPADQRFASIAELHAVTGGYRASARTAVVPYSALKAHARGTEVTLNGRTSEARLSHWAFGQLCYRAEAPAAYLRGLPASLAAECINTGLATRTGDAHLMFHSNGDLLMRAITSDKYDRIWNADVSKRLLTLTQDGWRLPPARPARANQPGTRIATADDVLPPEMAGGGGLSINIGDLIAPAGAYASDHDMFVFLIDPTRPIRDPMGETLWRGFFCWNSEVGAASFGLETFLFRHVCGNHIVWSASNVKQIRIRHVGDANQRARDMLGEVYRYRDASASDDEASLRKASTVRLGKDKDAVLDALFKMRLPVAQKVCIAAVDSAREHEATDGDPLSIYGVVNGFTRISQDTDYADERVAIDRAASKVMEIAF